MKDDSENLMMMALMNCFRDDHHLEAEGRTSIVEVGTAGPRVGA
jgi:hypothetical protein